MQKISPPPEFDSRATELVASRDSYWAIPDPVRGEYRKLNTEVFIAVYSSPNVIRGQSYENDMGGECSTYGGYERCIQGFGG